MQVEGRRVRAVRDEAALEGRVIGHGDRDVGHRLVEAQSVNLIVGTPRAFSMIENVPRAPSALCCVPS
jgi:hypothetical protein